MRLSDLEHIIRAAAEITNEYEFVVVGSQSILGAVADPPHECLMSMEADIYPRGAEHLSDKIDGAIGEGSLFHDQFGYYAQGVDSSTAVLPKNWQQRLHRLQSKATNDRLALCLDPTDLFLSKCYANRPKDQEFNAILVEYGIVQPKTALDRLEEMPVGQQEKTRMKSFILRSQSRATKNS